MATLRVATYNIHKGVQGLGPGRRLEIHNLAHAVEQFDADIVCLQEVRRHHRKLEKQFTRWPDLDQAGYLSPEGYESVYRTNATTRHGEHGNALLSRWPVIDVKHSDVSDHRFEQRGLLHVNLLVDGVEVHAIVVHFGLIHASRERQVQRLGAYILSTVPAGAPLIVAGDFNDWGAQLLRPMAAMDLHTFEGIRLATYPSRLPLLHLDRVFVRGLRLVSAKVPHGRVWSRMSDHLPLIAELEL
ncbi:endonuclease/exonuclease/phosphatase family protein [Hydrogenophaga sp.]|uniref:endonuclease/exonuclease/phosphatase family protein n=1 Tax=Hydrogenophaga sp. TaxID=1904254 RepID=UPI003D0ED498